MLQVYDWLVIGAGFIGASLSYELAKQGFSVLLVEQHAQMQGATRYSYGGLAFWSGTTDLTRQICAEGIAIHRTLSNELEADTQFREIDLVLTIAPTEDPTAIAASYDQFAIPPQLISAAAACELEPLLNRQAIAAALTVRHGQIEPQLTTQAYLNAFLRQGGRLHIGQVTGLLRGEQLQVTGVICSGDSFAALNVVVCAGAFSRSLLKAAGIPTRLYFTHAEIIETAPTPALHLRTMVSPATLKRFQLESAASNRAQDALWDQAGHELAPAIVDAGAVQLQDGRIRLGQLSRTLTDLQATIDQAASAAIIRHGVRQVLPALADLPGTWYRCQIAYSADQLPLIGAIPGVEGVQLFSGFSSPLASAPSLARRFAAHATGKADPLLAQLSPTRFS